jgi:uncharacterized membrane protein YkvA (DUF1232 family)
MSNLPSTETENSGSRSSRRRLATSSANPGTLRMLYERAVLTWRLMRDDRVDLLPKLIPVAAIAYVLSPLDLLPELLIGPFGAVDDIGIVLLALSLFIQAVPPDVVQEHMRQLSSGRGKTAADDDIVDGEILND